MPRPMSEREALERERDELPVQLANYQRELDATPVDCQERRDRLEWQLRRVRKRMAEVEARLARRLIVVGDEMSLNRSHES
jgi:glutathione S-transferase